MPSSVRIDDDTSLSVRVGGSNDRWTLVPECRPVEVSTSSTSTRIEILLPPTWLKTIGAQVHASIRRTELPTLSGPGGWTAVLPPFDLLLPDRWTPTPPIPSIRFDVLWVIKDTLSASSA